MPLDRNNSEERQERLDAMIAEFRAARQRRLQKLGLVHRAKPQRQSTFDPRSCRDKVN